MLGLHEAHQKLPFLDRNQSPSPSVVILQNNSQHNAFQRIPYTVSSILLQSLLRGRAYQPDHWDNPFFLLGSRVLVSVHSSTATMEDATPHLGSHIVVSRQLSPDRLLLLHIGLDLTDGMVYYSPALHIALRVSLSRSIIRGRTSFQLPENRTSH